jgi:hypothetical protein
MPWPAIADGYQHRRKELKLEYKVTSLPKLVIFNGQGALVTSNGVDVSKRVPFFRLMPKSIDKKSTSKPRVTPKRTQLAPAVFFVILIGSVIVTGWSIYSQRRSAD